MKFKRIVAFALVMVLSFGLFSGIKTEAKEITLTVPKIKVKLSNDGTSVKITIGKTKDADGYVICSTAEKNMYAGYEADIEEFQELVKIDKNGTKKRTITIKSLNPGKVKIAVKAYNEKKFGVLTYSKLSKSKSVTIKDGSLGLSTKYDFSDKKVGDIIKFGTYEQDNDFTNGKEAIEWVVISKTKSKMMVMSKHVLDTVRYYCGDVGNGSERKEITWENSTLRNWLNEKFYNVAFNNTEKDMILTTDVENYDDFLNGFNGGNDTKDKVFVLSELEAINSDYGFSDDYQEEDINRRAAGTEYAYARGLVKFSTKDRDYITNEGEVATTWWLRNTCFLSEKLYPNYISARVIDVTGNLATGYGSRVLNYWYNDIYKKIGVRPVIVINLKK